VGEVLERGGIRHVVAENDRVHVPVVVADHGLAEAVLAGRVPDLQFD
jgi:hypothetical protein